MKKKIPGWAWTCGILMSLAVFFRYALKGYAFTAYTLTFFACLVLCHRFLPRFWWKVLLVLVCIGFVYFAIVEVQIIKNARTDEDADKDYLIVLGAAVHGDTPSLSLKRRLNSTIEYMQQYPDATVIVSGGQGKGENMTEAKCMFDYLTERGMDPQRIIMEPKATSTKENLEFSFEIIRARGDEPDGSVAVLSSPYHLCRAKTMCRMLGVEAAGVAGHWDYPLLTMNYFIREAFGMTHLWVFGW